MSLEEKVSVLLRENLYVAAGMIGGIQGAASLIAREANAENDRRLQAELKEAERKVEELAKVLRGFVKGAQTDNATFVNTVQRKSCAVLESNGLLPAQFRPELIPDAWKPEVQARDNAEEEGRLAARDGKVRADANPYPVGSPEADAFDDGWFSENEEWLAKETERVLEPVTTLSNGGEVMRARNPAYDGATGIFEDYTGPGKEEPGPDQVAQEHDIATAGVWEPHDLERDGPVFWTRTDRNSDPCEDCPAEAGEPCLDHCPSKEDSR